MNDFTYYTYDHLNRNGRLGNILWQICSTIGIARSQIGIPRFPTTPYQEFFSFPEEYFTPPPKGAKIVDRGTDYLQEYHYFEFMKDEILEMAAPNRMSVDFIKNNYSHFFEHSNNTSLHVRRGDYLKYPKHFPLPTRRYYHAAVDLVKSENPGTRFVIFSDDPDWCLTHFDYLGVPEDSIVIRGTVTPVEVKDRKEKPRDQYDMFLMAYCKAHILSNSTFSWWGAFMAQADIKPIVPSVWFGPALKDTNWQLSIPSDWRYVKC